MKNVVNIQANIGWKAIKSNSSNRWIAICDELNLTTEADSLDELYSVIAETIHLLMLDLLIDDELDAYLKSRGWERAGELIDGSNEEVQFDVPFELIAAGQVGSERRTH